MGKGGILHFQTHVLSRQTSKFNFGAEFGGSLQAGLTSRMDLRLGYIDFHISDGDISEHNPGIDFIYLSAGLVFRIGGAERVRWNGTGPGHSGNGNPGLNPRSSRS